jgi:endonuclease YncB( thermonuclease family)
MSEDIDLSRGAVDNSVGMTNRSVPSHPIEVIDGDTVGFNGAAYRLVGIDTPERGDKARCDDETPPR